jgi:biotin carboxyl carrier protein
VANDSHAGLRRSPTSCQHCLGDATGRGASQHAPGISPAVGYFAPRDGVAVGVTLRAGDLIGAVDVLGVRQEVVSPIDGVLKVLEVESGAAVEYGQPIGRVEAGA